MGTPKQIQDLTLYAALGNNDLIIVVPNGTGDAKSAKIQSLVTFLQTTLATSASVYTKTQADAKFALIENATKNYDGLDNRPQINSVLVAGELSADDLGLIADTFKINDKSIQIVEGIPVITLTAEDISAASDEHASTHGTTGSDPIGPSDIGAVASDGGEVKDTICTFIVPDVKANISTGAALKDIIGMLARWYVEFGDGAFKDVGTTADDLAAGIHASTHNSDGTDPIKVGTTSGLPVFTGANGVVVTKSVSDALSTLKGVSSLAVSAATSASDLNALTSALSYVSTSTTNATALFTAIGGTYAIVFQYTDPASGVRQIAYSTTTNKVATRYFNSTWGSWSTIYTSDTAIPNTITKGGSGSFCSSSGTGTSITHGFGSVATSAYFVSVTPTETGGGNIGEIYVTKNADGTFKVFNTGSATTTFDWIVTKP